MSYSIVFVAYCTVHCTLLFLYCLYICPLYFECISTECNRCYDESNFPSGINKVIHLSMNHCKLLCPQKKVKKNGMVLYISSGSMKRHKGFLGFLGCSWRLAPVAVCNVLVVGSCSEQDSTDLSPHLRQHKRWIWTGVTEIAPSWAGNSGGW